MLNHMQARLDSAETVFFNRQLEFIKSKTYDIKFGALRANEFIPLSTEADEGSKLVTYEQFTEIGEAKFIGDNAKDSPRVDISGVEFPRPVRWGSASYGWTVMDVKAAAMANRNLQGRRANVARKSVDRLMDRTAFSGAPLHGIVDGFANDSDVPITPATGNWSALTADQIIADVSTMLQATVTATLGEERPDTLILPDAQWALIATLPRSTQSDTTVLEFIRRAFPNLSTIEPWFRFAGAGAGSVDRGILYERSEDILTHEMPAMFQQLPVQEDGLELVVHTMASTAGNAWYYPLAGRYIDGI
ncbi:MAG: DUF2184 domain-containing protein [Gammaproteobacteria bacterium]|nr:DUF2184 domain-containing protein [Gammaproteobacteria bacterium]